MGSHILRFDVGGGGLSILLSATYGIALGRTNSYGVSHERRRADHYALDWLDGMAFGNVLYVSVGVDTLELQLIVGSTNPPAFNGREARGTPGRHPIGATSRLLAVTYGNGRFVAVGEHGTFLQAFVQP